MPGSTGSPRRSTVPPAVSMAAGTTSRRSTIADAPRTTRTSQPAEARPARAAATSPSSCGQRRSASRLAPMPASLSRRTEDALSSIDGREPGSTVRTSPARRGRNSATRTSPPRARTMSRHASRWGRRTAKGITLTVAARRRGSTTVIAGRVARVSSSPTALTAATPSSSTVSTPRIAASRLQRPVNAVPVTSPVPGAGPSPDPPAAPAARASASSRAASFSATSSGSRRAVTTWSYPASPSAVTSSGDRRWPFLSTRPGSRNPWASIASSASRSGVGPKRTDVPGPSASPRGPAPGASR